MAIGAREYWTLNIKTRTFRSQESEILLVDTGYMFISIKLDVYVIIDSTWVIYGYVIIIYYVT